MSHNSLQKAMIECAQILEIAIDKYLPQEFPASRIIEAMRYSALAGGKKIRPFLALSCAKIFGVSSEKCLDVAVAIEFIHTYSLIHDDLPAMDNDDYRRGKLSNHKKFDEATAILAGDALLTLAFEILANISDCEDKMRCEIIKVLASAAGFRGMIGGQAIDIENNSKKITIEEIYNLHNLKTGALFVASIECASVLGKASSHEREALLAYAKNLGIAFQIKDDIIDYIDVANKKTADRLSIVDVIGLEASYEQLKILQNKITNNLHIFGEKSQSLLDLACYITSRDNHFN